MSNVQKRDPDSRAVTPETISSAEKLIGLEFTSGEREAMLEGSLKKLGDYHRLRNITLENDVPPSLLFSPYIHRNDAADSVEFRRSYPPSDVPPLNMPTDLEALAFFPVTHLAELIRTRRVTSLDLTQMYITRIKRYNPKLNCVITLTEDLAMMQAQRADAELKKGIYRGPLHGVPWGAKDLIAAKSYPTTWGAKLYEDRVIETDATVVERLEAAGAVLVAKLSTGTLAHGDVWFGGQTKNPWNIEEGAGGSSAGPASATAAGLVAFALGTETTGSIVWPALRNGVVGLRPTFGLVSRHGIMTLSWSLDKVGPIARTVEDCALVLNAIYGPDGRDPHMITPPKALNLDVDPSKVRVGYVKSAFENRDEELWREYDSLKPLIKMGIDLREHKANDDQTLDVLRSLNIHLIPIEVPRFDLDPMLIILSVEAAAAFDELTRSGQDKLLLDSDDFRLPNSFRQARLIPAVEYIQANRVRRLLMEEMSRVMEQVDVFVVPKLGDNNLTLTNLTGHPCVNVPNGFTDNGMPTGINFVGGLFREAEMLAVAQAVQGATAFHQEHPRMDY